MTAYDLPPVNAALNATSAILLLGGYIAIRRRKIRLHAALMISAVCVSAAFLTCYLIYHYRVPSKPFPIHTQPLRAIYYLILVSHILPAMAVVPMVLWTLSQALRRRWHKHRAIARPTFAVWLYVSITGVIVYGMLYHLPGWLGVGR